MNCKNCKNWVFGRCTVSNLIVGPGQLCNAWELSASYEQVKLPYATFDEKEFQKRIAELEAENDRLQDAWFWDETICPDGSLRPKVSSLLERIDDLDANWKGAQLAADCLKKRISELEERNEVLEDACEILRKQNDRLYEQVFSDNKPDLPEEVQE